MNFQDPVSHTLSNISKTKLSKSIKTARLNGKYKTKFDFSKIEEYDLFGNYLATYNNIEEAEKLTNISRKYILDCCRNYKKGRIRCNRRFRYAESKVPCQKFHFNNKYVGRYFDFYYIDNDGNEKVAFKDCRDV